ncbi:MAG: hypothetical protein PVG25_05910 [Anaerolineae bacterium]|jgi:hypothetical protein
MVRRDLQRAYLLRCWREAALEHSEAARWRFSVEEVLDKRERHGFDSLEALITFLRDELAGGKSDPRSRL